MFNIMISTLLKRKGYGRIDFDTPSRISSFLNPSLLTAFLNHVYTIRPLLCERFFSIVSFSNITMRNAGIIYCVCLKSITLCDCLFLLLLLLLLRRNFSGMSGNSQQKNILQTTGQLVQSSYLLVRQEIFLVYSFSEQVAAMGNSPETA